MTRTSFAASRRRLAALSLLAVLGASILGPSAAAAADAVDPATITAEEAHMVTLLNVDRTARGLVPVQIDTRLMAIARARSADMVAKNYFSHTQPDGRNVFDILTASRITWYGAGEIIAWNNYPMDTSATTANRQWMESPGHKAIIISTSYNYVGVGLAVDAATGKKLWTGVYMKGPDRTGARASVGTASVGSGTTSTRRVTIPWGGADVRLQVLTAGLRSFVLQKRVDDGTFATVWASTTIRTATFTMYLGHRYEIRVAAFDNRGNRGAWVYKVVDLR